MYENRVLAYIDILGFKSAIDKTIDANNKEIIDETENIANLLETVREHFRKQKGHDSTEQIMVSQFSDTIVISQLETDKNVIGSIIVYILYLCFTVLKSGVLLRGSIVYDKLYHTPQKIFGPAMVKAYRMEKDIAIYPRIIFDDSIYNKADHDVRESINKMTAKDFDGFYYIDYIDILKSNIFVISKVIPECFQSLTKLIRKNETSKDAKLRAKYAWLRNKYDTVIDSYRKRFAKGKARQQNSEFYKYLISSHLINIEEQQT